MPHGKKGVAPGAAASLPEDAPGSPENAPMRGPAAVTPGALSCELPPCSDPRPAPAGHCGGAGEHLTGGKLFLCFFLALLLFSLCLLYYLLEPFVHSIILSCVFTAISLPLYKRCLRLTGNRRMPAALIAILSITVLVVVPICIFIAGLIPQASASIAAVNQWLGSAHLGDTLNTHLQPLLQWLHEHFPEFDISLTDIRSNILAVSRNVGQYLLGSVSVFLGNTLRFFTHLLFILLFMFCLFMEGESMLRRLAYLFPMKSEQTAVVIESLRRMSRAVLVGNFCVAALQGIAGGVGFAFAGIPALFWGTVMACAALVPVVGTGLVWVPAVIVLVIMDEWKRALFLAIWCGVGVTSIDSIVRPLLMRGGADIPLIFIFIAILGGVNAFGMLGFLYGPMIVGLVSVMLNIYAEEYQDILQSRNRE
jgi:predicted PurR-regulated permease PerM